MWKGSARENIENSLEPGNRFLGTKTGLERKGKNEKGLKWLSQEAGTLLREKGALGPNILGVSGGGRMRDFHARNLDDPPPSGQGGGKKPDLNSHLNREKWGGLEKLRKTQMTA